MNKQGTLLYWPTKTRVIHTVNSKCLNQYNMYHTTHIYMYNNTGLKARLRNYRYVAWFVSNSQPYRPIYLAKNKEIWL